MLSFQSAKSVLPQINSTDCVCIYLFCLTEHITQSIVKSHLETCQYSAEDMKRFNYVQYTPEEMRTFQNKVNNPHVPSWGS